jgi:hypothetical protein
MIPGRVKKLPRGFSKNLSRLSLVKAAIPLLGAFRIRIPDKCPPQGIRNNFFFVTGMGPGGF